MCGIAAMVGNPDAATIAGMTRVLAHRGPDGEGVVCPQGEGFGLGNRRLSIIDLSSAGAQPMCDPAKRFWITYNGEVYNYREIRSDLERRGCCFRSQTDTEVVLAAFVSWGEACLERLNGMFALAIWDRQERSLFAARDRLGIKPLYWAESNGTLFLASEAKAILATGRIPVEADPEVTHNPWHYPLSPRTGFKGVFKLPAGHQLMWKNGRVTVKRWWELESTQEGLGSPHATEELAALLEGAVQGQMISDVPVGAMLSGGLDSSAIVALMSRYTAEPVRTFSICFRPVDRLLEAMRDDNRDARSVAMQFGCRHQEIEITPDIVDLLPRMAWHLDDPLFDPAAFNTYLIAREARNHGVTVLLNGMGADEIFGGYRKHYACLLAEKYQARVPDGVRRLIKRAVEMVPVGGPRTGFRVARWAKRFLSFASLPPVERFLASDLSIAPEDYDEIYADAGRLPYDHLEEVMARRALLDAGEGSYLARMCLLDTTTFLPDHNLAYMDKAAMAAGVEARPPLIDHRIVEFAARLPDSYRIQGSRQKVILRQAARRWLPRTVVRRPKAAFGVPLRAWIRRDLREMIDELLSMRAMRARGLYRPGAVRARIEADRDGQEDHAHFTWNLLCREVWFRTFIDGGGAALQDAKKVFRRAALEAPAEVPDTLMESAENGSETSFGEPRC